ncbi:Ig-like domain repeat protein [Tundrisphaera sp. TA3]|uniref:Ig-like domain repeat protein n=1 Tax=Tundrisphaera sp. TA3 TaxID=3435775 RepID=UPI003EBED6A9
MRYLPFALASPGHPPRRRGLNPRAEGLEPRRLLDASSPPATLQASATFAQDQAAAYSHGDRAIALVAYATSGDQISDGGTMTFRILDGAKVIGEPVSYDVTSSGAVAGSTGDVQVLNYAIYTVPGGTAPGVYTIEASYSGGPGHTFSYVVDPFPHPIITGPGEIQFEYTRRVVVNAGTFAPSSDSSHTLTIAPGLDLTSDAASAPRGQPITFTASRPDRLSHGGSVQFVVDGANRGEPVPMRADGTASFTDPSLAAGTHAVWAVYNGVDGLFAESETFTQTVVPAATTTVVAPDSSASAYGQAATFTAVVSAGTPGAATPSGTVQFYVDGVASGAPVPVDAAGRASFAAAGLHAGYHGVSAIFDPADPAELSGSHDMDSPAVLLVTPAPLLIVADDASSPLGAAPPPFTASYSGFVNGDTAASLATALALESLASASSPAGTYPILASGASSPDYSITFRPGTLTIVPPPATPPATPIGPMPATAVADIQVVRNRGKIVRVVVQYSGSPEAVPAGKAAMYRLALGTGRRHATVYARTLPLKAAAFDPATGRATLRLRAGVAASAKLRLRVGGKILGGADQVFELPPGRA